MQRWWSVVLVVALLATAVGTVSAAPKAAPWVGAWEAIDGDVDGDGVPEGADGSYMRLTIGAGPKGVYQFNYKDYGASCCGKDEQGVPLYAATVIGRLSLNEEGVLTGEGPLVCLAHPVYEHPDSPLSVWFTHDAATDTLFDGWVTWQRMGATGIRR